MNSGVPLGRLFGAEIRAHWTWIFVLALVTVYFGAGLSQQTEAGFNVAFGWGAAIACAILVFGSVTVHELGHVWVARRNGFGGNVAVVQLLGGTYLMETRPKNAGQELRSALAGPIISLAVMGVFAAVVAVTEVGWGVLDASNPASAGIPTGVIAASFVGQVLALFNLFLACTNLLPAYPMDGARVVHAIAWARSGREDRAMAVSSRIGRFVGIAIMMLGAALIPIVDVWPGVMLILAGWLLVSSSRILDRRAMLQALMAGMKVSDAIDDDPALIPPQLTLDVFAGDYLGERMGGVALVERDHEIVGMIGTSQIRRIPRRNWTTIRTEQAMVPIAKVPRTSGDADLWGALEALERSGLDGLLVGTDAQTTTLLTRRSAAKVIRERAQARALALNASMVGQRFPGRRPLGPPPGPPVALGGDSGAQADQPESERDGGPGSGPGSEPLEPAHEPTDDRKDG